MPSPLRAAMCPPPPPSLACMYTFFSPSTIYIRFPYSFRILVQNRVYILEYGKNTAPNRAYILKYSGLRALRKRGIKKPRRAISAKNLRNHGAPQARLREKGQTRV